ncbi:macrophage mannose receptor 1-like [Acanthaster planci]|uniref:Macrophage mannose receptor 1-like n=1 Tax=Acanthaster planci TaxID=133434 RepID=A0A8B7Y7I2_ACAPL|nr:macrophage mannose receptor 1-like [Acanthaster planci]
MWEPTNCWRSYRYVCKKKKVDDGTVHTPSPPPTSDYELRCGMGWEYDASTNTCYVFRPHLFENWHDALYQCRVEGGDLISVTGPEDQQFIRGHLHNSGQIYTWMGCNDLGREGGWEWSDNSPFAFINWNAGQPDNGGGASPLGHHCCSFFSNSGTWVDHQCEQEQGYSCKRKAYILKYYSTSTQRKLPDHSDLTKFWYNVWPKDCAHICLHVTTCLSFDYRREHRSCYLSSLDAVSAGGLVTTEPGDHYDYYERDLTVPSPTRPPPLPSEYNCPPDWGRYDGHCYSLNTTKMDLLTAESSCRSVGAELATIEDRNTNNFIRGYMHEVAPSENRIWIGLSDRTLEGWFSWSDGEPVTFTNWDSGQPDNGDENDCTEMHIDSGYWRDTKCTGNYLSALCRKPIDLAPPPPVDDSCPDGWVPWMGKCYLANQTRAAWADAASMCSTEGGQLVVIEDGYELAFLSGVLGLKRWDNYFIGLSDLASRGYYQWIDQSEVTFTNWASGQPDDSTGNCVTMKSGSDAGYWSDRSCEKGYLFICEKSRIGWPTITLPTANPPTQPSDVGCSPGWIGYGDNCFKPFEISSAQDGSTWVEAYTACGSFGASLASFHHPNEERHIIDSFTPTSDRGFWIGLNDWRNEGGYEWSDGSVVQYTYWHTGQPNDSGGREQCVLTFLSTTTGWFDAPCYQELNFICKMPKGIELRTTSAPTLSPGEPCADDPTWIHRYPYCYFFSSSFEFDGVQDWHHAEAWCQAKNSHLVSIHDSAELSFLLEYSQLFASYFWIGLRENGSYAGHYEWSDGSLLDFENWRSGQPDDMNGEEQCVEMQKFFSSPPGCWSDNNCGVQRQFICKRNVDDPPVATPAPTEVPVGGCPTGWWKHNHRCYMIGGKTFNTRKTWHDARAECQKTPGANLASIHNDNIQTLLAAFLTTTEYDVWIGLSSLGTSGRFLWNDGSSFDYENWGYNEPDGSNSQNSTDCVKLMNEAEETGKWNDEDCSKRNSYVCLMKPDPTIPETNFTLPACPYKPGYIYNGKACFKLDTSKLRSMGEAKQYCADDGATVASILNGYEQALLQAMANEYANGSVWLGLEKDPTTNTLKWIDGWPLHYSNWGWGSPNGADCAIMAKREWFWEDGEWMTVGCVFPRYTACKIATALPPTPHPTSAGYCPPGWKEFGSGCYVVPSNIFNQKSFPEARYDCQFSRGADLVMIDSQAENQFVRQLAEERFGLSEILLGLHRNTHGGWDWIDGTPASYVNWGSERPATVSQNCAMMHLDSQGKWFGTSCFAENHYMCEKPKIPYSSTQVPTVTGHVTLPYSSTKVPINATGRATLPPLSPPTGIATTVGGVPCTSGWIARGDYCYYIETGNRLDWLTWSEADAFCNNHGGHLTSIHSFAENDYIRSHTSPVNKNYWIGLREKVAGGVHIWSDKTEFYYDNWNSGEPNDHAGEEKCVEMYPTSGKWNDMACGIPQPFICKKLASNNDPIPVPSPYPLTGGCEDDWYRLGYQCYKLFGDSVSSPALPYREARDDCVDRGGNLASVSSQDVQIFLTALMDQLSSTHCWMGLNRLVDDFHWTDGSRLNFTNWAPGNPALQGGCVHMLKGNITTSGQWANIEGSANESYICQKPLDKNRPDTWIDIPCDIPGYSSFGQTCYKVDSTPNSYNEAELNCHGDPGTLASIGNRFEEALIRSALTYHGIGDAWIGLKRDNSGTFSWLNENQLSYVNWNHNEPSSREGEGCVRMLPGKVWDNTACSSKRASVCQIGGVSRIPSTSATPRYCGMAGWEQDGSECLLFNTGLTRVSRDEAQEKCKRAYGAVLPAVHSDEQNEFIRSNARTDKPLSSGRVWLQIYRNSKGDFVYNDTEGSKVDYVNWAIGQPDGQSVGADCVAMDVNDGKWSDEFCDVRKADCVCRLPTSEGYPKTELPYTSEFETGKPGTLSPKPQTGGLSGGAIVGIVIAVIIVVVAGLVAAYLFLGRWRGKGNFMEDRDVMSTTGFENAAYFSNIEVDATTT